MTSELGDLGHSFVGAPGMTLFALVLTLGAYLIGVALQARAPGTIRAYVNPVLLAIVLIGIALRLLRIDYATYFAGAQFIHFLLGPATVALAVPLVRALEHIRRGFWAMSAGLLAGCVTGLVSGYALVRGLGGSQVVALSMAPKSVTTPIALAVSQGIGGVSSLTAVLAIAGGIAVAVALDPVLRLVRVGEATARGLAAGTAGSGIGGARVIPEGPVTAAFAGVAIGVNGFLTAVLAPLIMPLLKRW